MEGTSEPWDENQFRHEVRRVARLASIPDDLQFRDLRATAMTEFADAGADVIDMSTHSTHKPYRWRGATLGPRRRNVTGRRPSASPHARTSRAQTTEPRRNDGTGSS
jgi:hypothetical protein